MTRSLRGLLVVSVLALAASSARALPLPPGGTISGANNKVTTYTGTVVTEIPFQNATFFIPSTNTVGFISSAAVNNGTPFLDFVYQVNVSAGNVSALSITSFHNISTDVVQTADRSGLSNTNQYFPGTVPASSFSRTGGSGDTINVSFGSSGIGAEQASFIVVIHTDSQTFAMSNVQVNGPNGITVSALAPVPEPATLALWGGTFGGLGCWMVRRRTRSAH
jgi:hypothetical protein